MLDVEQVPHRLHVLLQLSRRTKRAVLHDGASGQPGRIPGSAAVCTSSINAAARRTHAVYRVNSNAEVDYYRVASERHAYPMPARNAEHQRDLQEKYV